MFTQAEIDLMDKDQCLMAIQRIDKKYGLDKTIVKYTDELDQAVNAVIGLENRIKALEQPQEALVEELKPAPIPRAPTQRRVQTPKGIFLNVDDACEKMGVKRHTIIAYICNRNDKYRYLDD